MRSVLFICASSRYKKGGTCVRLTLPIAFQLLNIIINPLERIARAIKNSTMAMLLCFTAVSSEPLAKTTDIDTLHALRDQAIAKQYGYQPREV